MKNKNLGGNSAFFTCKYIKTWLSLNIPAQIRCRACAFLAMTLTHVWPWLATTSTTRFSERPSMAKGERICTTPGALYAAWIHPAKWPRLLLFKWFPQTSAPENFFSWKTHTKKRGYFILSWKKEVILRTSAGKNGIITSSARKKKIIQLQLVKRGYYKFSWKKTQDNTTSVWKKRIILELQLDFSWKKEDIKTSRRKEEDNRKRGYYNSAGKEEDIRN